MLNEGLRSFTAGVALSEGERVIVTSGTTTTPPEVSLAPVGDIAGVAQLPHIGYVEASAAAGELVTVRPRAMNGTKQAVASAAFAVGVEVYRSANGRVSSTASGSAIGVALEASSGAGDIVEIIEY